MNEEHVQAAASGHERATDFAELSKPGIVGLIMVTVAAGFNLGAPEGIAGLKLFHTLLGAAAVAAGSNALNQIWERRIDARMGRTSGRPIPAGRMALPEANLFAWTLGLGGIAYMAAFVNLLTALLAALTLVTYVFLYTPLKRKTSLCTLVGAVPGALPIVGGWTAARGSLDLTAVALFAVLFLWQLPHFLSLSWLYRDDYARAGLRMLCVTRGGRVNFRMALVYSVALLPASLMPTILGATGSLYFYGALALTAWMIWAAGTAAWEHSRPRARRLFLVTLAYLPALLVLMVVDKA